MTTPTGNEYHDAARAAQVARLVERIRLDADDVGVDDITMVVPECGMGWDDLGRRAGLTGRTSPEVRRAVARAVAVIMRDRLEHPDPFEGL